MDNDRPDKCECNEEYQSAHTCPYAEEIRDDYTTLCYCCEYCTWQCCMDI